MFRKIFTIIFISGFLLLRPAVAAEVDSDGDGISDDKEINVYLTDPHNQDTDGDGYGDNEELINGYSPLHGDRVRLLDVDTDNDGLSDGLELAFHTKLNNSDTDGDGYSDGEEVKNGYSPINPKPEKLEKKIEIDISDQRLKYFLGYAQLGSFPVSTGTAAMPTPTGDFKIEKKGLRIWSRAGQLWMPYWMAFYKNGMYAIHELPEWPNGVKEGADHLGRPASHGCVRLGVGPAKLLYDWTPIGTKIIISR